MRDSFLPFAPPDIGNDEIAAVVETLRSGWMTTGPKTAAFEKSFAETVGAEAALALNSGTAALHLALLAHGIGAGDEVVVPVMTFSSDAHVVEHVGARPAFVDVDPTTLNLASSDGRWCMPVHLYGGPCTVGGKIAVEDAAHAIPARIDGITIGGRGNLTAFSFYATKNLTTGEGGMLTGPGELVERARAWSLHGMSRDAWRRYDGTGSWRYDVDRAGFKYNITDLASAIGLVQLKRLPDLYTRRRAIAGRYTEALSSFPELELPNEQPGTQHAWHIYAIRLHLDRMKIDRDQFIEELRVRNIGTSVHFIPIHLLSYYRDKYGLRTEDFPVATREFERLVSIPIYPQMTDRDVDDVIVAVDDVITRHRR